jgi:hypothetical protein
MSYLRRIHELRSRGGEEAVLRYEQIEGYEGRIAACEEEIEHCKQAIKILENGQDPHKVPKEEKDEISF